MTPNNINTAQGTQAAVFRLRDKTLAVDIACTRKITGMMDITVVNEPEGFIKGVVNLQGQVIVVVDLAGQLGILPLEGPASTAQMVFIEFRKKMFGFIVDKVLGVSRVPQVLDLEKIFLKLI